MSCSALRVARGDGLWKRSRIDIGARLLHEQLDQLVRARDEGTERTDGLAERADQHWHVIGVELEVLERAPSACTEDADAVRVIHDQPGLLLVRRRGQSTAGGRHRHPC